MTTPAPLMPNPGSERDPAHFVGRAAFTSEALTCLRQGMNLLISDPRRMGKSFWLRWLAARTTEFIVVWIDYEGVQTVEDFVVRTATRLTEVQSLPTRVRNVLRAFFDNTDVEAHGKAVTIKKHFAATDPLTLLTDTLTAIEKALPSGRPGLVIAMDEVPVAIENLAAGQPENGRNAALEMLRTMRLLRQDTNHIRWIVTGSVGFHHVLRRCGATTGEINDLHTLAMGPLNRADTIELTTRLFAGIRRNPIGNAIDTMVECTGGIPQLIHEVASRLQFGPDDERPPAPVDGVEVQTTFEDFIDDRDQSHAVTHYLTRLDKYYGSDYFGQDEVLTARRLLDAVTQAGSQGLSHDALPETIAADNAVNYVIESLIDDHYLITSRDSKLRWRYPVMGYIYGRRQGLVKP